MKQINFKAGETIVAGFIDSSTDRRDLYGKKVVVARPGKAGTQTEEVLERGLLRGNGERLRRRDIKSITVDPEGFPAEATKTVRGSTMIEAEKIPVTAELVLNAIPFSRLHEFSTKGFTGLVVPGVEPGLYETEYLGRASFQRKLALVLVREKVSDADDLAARNESGKPNAFLLQGELRLSTWVGHQVDHSFFDADEPEAESEEDSLSVSF